MVVRIVTDSTADLEKEEARELAIEIVPLNVHFGDESYRDGFDLSPEQFYQRLPLASPPPRTSAPSPGSFLEAFKRAGSAGDPVFCITISGRLSGTFNAAQAAREHADNPKQIEIFDSLGATAAEANIVICAANAAGAGESIDEVRAASERARGNQELLIGLETLEYLQRGGRIGRATAFLGGLLNVKPLLTLRDGEVAPAERVRSRTRLLARLEAFVHSRPNPQMISIAQADAREDAKALAGRLQRAFPHAQVSSRWIGPAVGLYTGPGAIGVAVVSATAA
jgi:fatty acid kinase fatty acid binding subunit